MTDAEIAHLREVADGLTQGSSLDRAWRALCRRGYVYELGPGANSHTSIYEITDDGRAVLEAHDVAEASL